MSTAAFELPPLARFLREHIPDLQSPLSIQAFEGGQSNPTYLLSAGSQRYVLRKKPAGALLPSAHAVDREYRVMSALAGSQVPVPRMRVYCEDDSVIGTAFYVMDFVEGRILWDPRLPEVGSAAERAAMYEQINRVIAALHSVDYAACGLGDYGRAEHYIERQIGRWTKQYRASETERIEAMEQLIAWLPANIPAGEMSAIAHGDLRLDNLIFHPSEPRVLAVLDWELSTIGHPLADLAYYMMAWRLNRQEFRGFGGEDLAPLGIPSEQAFLARYCERRGLAPIAQNEWDFYLAFNMFRLAAILQGVLKRALSGNAASAQGLENGRRTRPIAEAGWRQVEQILARPR
ncbi:Predicted kinase, aminoglycoside phosphotransferase (APT) family [Solimonas aquatica]|uniref:Predicted kinase, aminoglycoside phosphotransferase (APT) family n=1 Tax=Solimonas aquatica TaxID=489703 RepID=A0A1H9GFJ3_9GAMM|nr:phosphotransferase [Solimonas aquatica]SEQ48813.1 Predicted kinase, aminoglycoside phosphotransferase (APT) family [Solimonas aquatica]